MGSLAATQAIMIKDVETAIDRSEFIARVCIPELCLSVIIKAIETTTYRSEFISRVCIAIAIPAV